MAQGDSRNFLALFPNKLLSSAEMSISNPYYMRDNSSLTLQHGILVNDIFAPLLLKVACDW